MCKLDFAIKFDSFFLEGLKYHECFNSTENVPIPKTTACLSNDNQRTVIYNFLTLIGIVAAKKIN